MDILLACAGISLPAHAEFGVDWSLETTVNAGSGVFAPTYLSSNVHGVVNAPVGAYERATVRHDMDTHSRFSWGFGADIIAGAGKGVSYWKYDDRTGDWFTHRIHPPSFMLQQLYGEIKFHAIFLSVGMKEYEPLMVDRRLSSGDLTFSGNTRPMPGFRLGFLDFVDIPFTNGWVQIQGELGYGKAMDNGWVEDHYNFFNGRYNPGWWYNYKRCYFRTKPSQPFSVTVGMQAAGQFCGTTYDYHDGAIREIVDRPVALKYFIQMLIPTNGEGYYTGNHVGSWDLKARYTLPGGHEVAAYFEWPWEDGSGIGKLNGFDGLWGLEYHSPDSNGWITGAVVEYLDFMNQSGAIHWATGDHPGTTILGEATGMDNYYNNALTNGYAYYGRGIGSPFIPSTFYNINGSNTFLCTRIRGFHIGAEGRLAPAVGWRMLGGWRKGWGNYNQPFIEPRSDTSVMAECTWSVTRRLSLKGQVAIDHGSLFGNNFGGLLSITFTN